MNLTPYMYQDLFTEISKYLSMGYLLKAFVKNLSCDEYKSGFNHLLEVIHRNLKPEVYNEEYCDKYILWRDHHLSGIPSYQPRFPDPFDIVIKEYYEINTFDDLIGHLFSMAMYEKLVRHYSNIHISSQFIENDLRKILQMIIERQFKKLFFKMYPELEKYYVESSGLIGKYELEIFYLKSKKLEKMIVSNGRFTNKGPKCFQTYLFFNKYDTDYKEKYRLKIHDLKNCKGRNELTYEEFRVRNLTLLKPKPHC